MSCPEWPNIDRASAAHHELAPLSFHFERRGADRGCCLGILQHDQSIIAHLRRPSASGDSGDNSVRFAQQADHQMIAWQA